MAEAILASPKEKLLEEVVALDAATENIEATWRLAYWLAANVPVGLAGRPEKSVTRVTDSLTIEEVAKACGKGRTWYSTLRNTALNFPTHVDGISPKVHATALSQARGDKAAALEAIRLKGGKLRDHTPGQDIESARRILENPETRAEVLTRLDRQVLREVEVDVARNRYEADREYEARYYIPPPPPEPVQLQLLLIRVNDEFRGIMRQIRAWSFGVQELAPYTREISDWDRAAIIELLAEADLEFQAVRRAWLEERRDEEPTPAALAQLEQTIQARQA